jgi:uncharacterized protein YdcH (DUF465 family)
MNEFDVKAYLIENNQDFRQLVEQHQGYETQLQDFQGKPYLNEQEKLEETVLKKKKLALKDHMQALIQHHQGQQAVN